MSKTDYIEKTLAESVKIGLNNQRIIPLIKNWCKHVVLTDFSAGMIAEMYQIPTNVKISCPHTTVAWSGMQLEACANDFIIQACTSCTYHEEISNNNLGVEILKKHKEREAKLAEKALSDKQKKAILKAEADKLVGDEMAFLGITKLSVLNLVQLLEDETNQQETAEKILEAVKLKPEYFTSTTVDYMSIFAEKECGKALLQSIIAIQNYGLKISDFAIGNLKILIEENINSDEAAAVIVSTFTDKELPLYKDFLSKIFSNCIYFDPYNMCHREDHAYKNSISIFIKLSKLDKKLFDEIVGSGINDDSSFTRINTNGFLTDLCKSTPELVIPYLQQLVKSLEKPDDVHGDSADYRIKKTLEALYYFYPTEVIEELMKQYSELSELARIEIIDFWKRLIKDDETFTLYEFKYSFLIVSNLLDMLLTKSTTSVIEHKIADTLADISKSRPELLTDKFDHAFGYLIITIQKKLTFTWFRNELQKSDGTSSTFNPLLGKSYIDIISEESDIEEKIRFSKKMIKHLITLNPDRYIPQIISSINNLDSKKDGLLKCQLIDLLKNSVEDALILSKLLPDIYNFLFDTESEEIREMGVRFAIYIFNDFPEIVTQNLIPTLKIFLGDQSIGVRGRAIEAYGIILRKYPEENDAESLKGVIDGLDNKYVFIHKSSAAISYDVFPFLDPMQRAFWIQCLMNQEAYYFKKEQYDYCQQLVEQLLFYTKVEPEMYKIVVFKILLKYTEIKEYYTVTNFLEKLSYIAEQDGQFQEIWMKSAFTFLRNTMPAPMGQEPTERVNLVNQLYRVKPEVLIENMKPFQSYARSRVDNFYYKDIVDCFGIFAFFGFWNDCKIFITYCKSKIEKNASNAYVNDLIDMIERISAIEILVADKSLSKNEIQILVK